MTGRDTTSKTSRRQKDNDQTEMSIEPITRKDIVESISYQILGMALGYMLVQPSLWVPELIPLYMFSGFIMIGPAILAGGRFSYVGASCATVLAVGPIGIPVFWASIDLLTALITAL